MFFKRKYDLKSSNLLFGFVDTHSHILPNVDDGFSQQDEALETLQNMKECGLTKVWLTPHVMGEIAENKKDDLLQHFDDFKRYNTSGIELKLAAEYMIDMKFRSLWADKLLTFAENKVLVENSYLAPYNEWEKILFELRLEGYGVIIAHPERYLYFRKEMYEKLKNQKYHFQLGLFSLLGYYGKEVKERATLLLENGMYDYAGTDVHDYQTWTLAVKEKCLTFAQLNKLEKIFNNNKTL